MAGPLTLTIPPTFFLKESTTAADGANHSAGDSLFGWLQRLMQPGILRFAVIIGYGIAPAIRWWTRSSARFSSIRA